MIQIPDQHVTFFAHTCSFNDDLATSQYYVLTGYHIASVIVWFPVSDIATLFTKGYQ